MCEINGYDRIIHSTLSCYALLKQIIQHDTHRNTHKSDTCTHQTKHNYMHTYACILPQSLHTLACFMWSAHEKTRDLYPSLNEIKSGLEVWEPVRGYGKSQVQLCLQIRRSSDRSRHYQGSALINPLTLSHFRNKRIFTHFYFRNKRISTHFSLIS